MSEQQQADVIVIGGGAAGLLAAGQAAAQGARVLVLEKMSRPGRKLLVTGNGRCNVTNTALMNDFLEHFGPNGRFLRGAFSAFFAQDLIALLEARGVRTVTEAGGRVFPASAAAQDILDALLGWAKEAGVHGGRARFETNAPVERLLAAEGRITGVEVASVRIEERRKSDPTPVSRVLPRRVYRAPVVILATGGMSYPGTGSTGDGYQLAEALGHSIEPLRPALVPLETGGSVAASLQGISLSEVGVRLVIDGKPRPGRIGDIMFTHYGVSGPAVLVVSGAAVDALRAGSRVRLSLDLLPTQDEAALDQRLLKDFDSHGSAQVGTLLRNYAARALVPICAELTSIPSDKNAGQISAKERRRLRMWLKDFWLDVTGPRSWNEAIITAGGIRLDEVDPATLESRLVPGLFFAGEVLDLNADTGGFNLQAAFSTGWLAGQSAGRFALSR